VEAFLEKHLSELKALGLIDGKAERIVGMMDRAAEELYASEIEHYLAREVNPEHRTIFAKHGLCGLQVPETYGGLGANAITYALAFERLGQLGLGPVTMLDVQCSLTEIPLLYYGSEEQRRRYLPRAARGELFMAFCLTEPEVGSNAAGIASQYIREGKGYRIRGTKYLITNASFAGVFIVFAREAGGSRISAFLVDREDNGPERIQVSLHLGEKLGLFTSDTTLLEFNDAYVPQENLLGEEGKGLHVAYSGLLSGRIGIAAGCVGVMEDCLKACLERAKHRQQFGKPLAKHQLIQDYIAAIAKRLEWARWPVYMAALAKDRYEAKPSDPGLRAEADYRSALAKNIATRAAWEASDYALQVFGGFGYSTLSPVGRHYLDTRVTRIYEGAEGVLDLKIASALLGKEYEAYA
jgi:alkylation response protein AidB-like acyl-CoA dehydrogenase